MRCGFSTTRNEEEVSLDGQVVPHKDTFDILGQCRNVNNRIKAGWMKCAELLTFL
jgi:hypothetical protein